MGVLRSLFGLEKIPDDARARTKSEDAAGDEPVHLHSKVAMADFLTQNAKARRDLDDLNKRLSKDRGRTGGS